MQRGLERYLSLVAAVLGACLNVIVALRLLALWRSLGWESETEWEGKADTWRVDGVKIVWGLFFAYFAAAAGACAIGVAGLLKNKPALVRFYRDYSIADFVFLTVSTLYMSYTSFSRYVVRASVCEELSRHPDLMRDMSEMGLTLENCELWFERAMLVVMGVMFILIVVRLQMVIVVNKFYQYLVRDPYASGTSHFVLRAHSPESLHRIYLLPSATTPGPASFNYNFNVPSATNSAGDVMVYAPVPVGGISEQEARKMNATEAWISSPSTPRGHRHTHSHSHSHSHSRPHSRSRGHRHSRSVASPRRASEEEKAELISLV